MIKFSTDSWHYKLANFGKDRIPDWLETDICRYSRAVVSGFIALIMITFLCCILVGFMSYAVYEHYQWFAGQASLGPVAFLLDCTILFVVCIVTLEMLKHKIRAFSDKKVYNKLFNTAPPDNFLLVLYRKFKEKTCYKVTFDETSDRK